MKRYLFALCLYLPTTGFVSPIFYSLLLIFLFAELIEKREFNISNNLYFVIIFILLSALLLSIHNVILPADFLDNSYGNLQKLPFILLLIFSILLTKLIDVPTVKILISLILIEVLFGCIEYMLGTRSLFFALQGTTGFNESQYWYYHKVYGLSSNSTPFAFKCLLALILLYYVKETLSRHFFYCANVILMIGLIISFSRSALIATFVFFTMYLFKIYTRIEQRIALVLCYLLGFIVFGSTMLLQFNRGQSTIDYSYRDIIFQKYSDYISSHLFWGNSGVKLRLTIDDKVYHAHNSFVDLFASNGILIGGFFLVILGFCIRKKSVTYILPVLIFSMFQYGIFWGLSFYDVVFFFLLFNAWTSKNNAFERSLIK